MEAVAVTYPHENACPNSEALCNRMVRIHRRAELPLKQNRTIKQRMIVRGVKEGC